MPNQVIPSIPSTPRCRVGRPRQAGTVPMRVPMQCVSVGRVGGSGRWWVGGQRGKHTEMSVCGCARPYARPRFRRQLCVPDEAGRAAPTKMASVPGTVATHPPRMLPCAIAIRSRDSSVGRASDRRFEGPQFDPGSRHCCLLVVMNGVKQLCKVKK